jgi:hypothetical protein
VLFLTLPKHDNFICRDAELLHEWQENPDSSELIRCYELTSSIELIKVRVSCALASAPDSMVAVCCAEVPLMICLSLMTALAVDGAHHVHALLRAVHLLLKTGLCEVWLA